MNTRKKILVCVDKIKDLNSGLGRISIEFANELKKNTEFEYTFLLPAHYKGDAFSGCKVIRLTRLKKYFSDYMKHFDLVHLLYQSPGYSFRKARKVPAGHPFFPRAQLLTASLEQRYMKHRGICENAGCRACHSETVSGSRFPPSASTNRARALCVRPVQARIQRIVVLIFREVQDVRSKIPLFHSLLSATISDLVSHSGTIRSAAGAQERVDPTNRPARRVYPTNG